MVKDIIIDDTGELVFSNGDFVIRDSDPQHVLLLVNSMPGSWKQFPTAGVGIINYSGSSGRTAELRRLISVQLEGDGYRDVEVGVTQNGQEVEYSVIANRP